MSFLEVPFMTARLILGIIAKQGFLHDGMTCVTRIGRQYYRTAQKVDRISHKKTSLPNQECLSHNNRIPTYEKVKSDPALQRRLEQMYKKFARDPDFNEVTIDSMRWGVKSLAKEKVS
jgi:hypothetical protein